MPDDQLTLALIAEYRSISDRLTDGQVIDAVTMSRYHGMTGQLLAYCVKVMWSDGQLTERINALQTARCRECSNTASVTQLMAASQQLQERVIKMSGELEVVMKSSGDPGAQQGGMLAWVLRIAEKNARSIIAWIGIVSMVIVLKGELKTALDAIPHRRPADVESGN